MNKAELVGIVSEKVDGVTKAQVSEIYDAIFETIKKAVDVDKRYQVSGFGTFDRRERKARTGRNPKTGEAVQIAASVTMGFKPAKAVKSESK